VDDPSARTYKNTLVFLAADQNRRQELELERAARQQAAEQESVMVEDLLVKPGPGATPSEQRPTLPKRFHGAIKLDPVRLTPAPAHNLHR